MEQLTEIEKLCQKTTEDKIGAEVWAAYVVARAKVFNDLLPYIRKNEPFLTDHGPTHITNVLNNAYLLLGKGCCVGKESTRSLEPAELYLLVLSILFHDVGNVFGRKGHKSRLQEAYEFARGTDQSLLQEKTLLFKIVEAHGGETPQGSPDTIGPLERQGIFKGKRVDCQRVAAVLRFADELAEGQQRTSLFMQKHLGIPEDAQVFHDCANVMDPHIGREDGRVALVFNIEIAPALWGNTYDGERLRNLLEFCYHRIHKLELERKYNRHYCSLLAPFKKTEVTFHFHNHGVDLRLELPKMVLNDLVLPDKIDGTQIWKPFASYDLDKLMPRLEAAVNAAAAVPV